jgi:hypothetical protein
VVSVPLDGTGSTVTVTAGATCSASGGTSDFALSYGNSSRAFAQATVAGGELYVVTDSDIEPNAETYGLTANTGQLYRIQLDSPSIGSAITVSGGAGEVDAHGGNVYVGGGLGVEKESFMDFDALSGGATELLGNFRTARRLWLRIL